MQVVEFGGGRISTLKNFIEIEKPEKILLLRGLKSYDFFAKRADEMVECEFVSFIVWF